MTNFDLSAAIAAAANELQGGAQTTQDEGADKGTQKAQKAQKAAPKKSAPKTSAKPAKTSTTAAQPKATYSIPKEFKEAIAAYLASRPDMSEKMQKKSKSIDGCCEYIWEKMRRRAEKERHGGSMVGLFAKDEEVYGLAVHYYDESEESLKNEKD